MTDVVGAAGEDATHSVEMQMADGPTPENTNVTAAGCADTGPGKGMWSEEGCSEDVSNAPPHVMVCMVPSMAVLTELLRLCLIFLRNYFLPSSERCVMCVFRHRKRSRLTTYYMNRGSV